MPEVDRKKCPRGAEHDWAIFATYRACRKCRGVLSSDAKCPDGHSWYYAKEPPITRTCLECGEIETNTFKLCSTGHRWRIQGEVRTCEVCEKTGAVMRW